MTDAELLEIIARAEREGWTELDLSGNDLEVLPPEIGRLQSLEKLILGKWDDKRERKGNRLTAIPQEIFQLTNLKELYIANNQISVIPESIAQLAWARQVENLAKQQTVSQFDLNQLKAAIHNILRLSENAEDVKRVPEMLLSLGGHFLIVPHLSKTYLDGAAFYLGEHPVIALTMRYDRIDAFWFTLMYEFGHHIVARHQGSYLDVLGNLAITDEESEANQLAANWLINPLALQEFVVKHQPQFSRKEIEQFAHSQKRYLGIILGRLHNDQLVPHKNLRALLAKVSSFQKVTD